MSEDVDRIGDGLCKTESVSQHFHIIRKVINETYILCRCAHQKNLIFSMLIFSFTNENKEVFLNFFDKVPIFC